MSKVIIGGGGAGGISSDDLDTLPGDVLAGKKFGGVGSDELQIGTMPSYGGTYWNRDMGVGLEPDNFYSFFPPGHYASFDSRGSLHRIPIAKVQGAIGATGNKIIPGQSICGVAGTVASMGAQTINPSASQQSIATSGKYMTGNVTINPVANLSANNIIKGVTVGGVAGTRNYYDSYKIRVVNDTTTRTLTTNDMILPYFHQDMIYGSYIQLRMYIKFSNGSETWSWHPAGISTQMIAHTYAGTIRVESSILRNADGNFKVYLRSESGSYNFNLLKVDIYGKTTANING